jgi:hypothetical protein
MRKSPSIRSSRTRRPAPPSPDSTTHSTTHSTTRSEPETGLTTEPFDADADADADDDAGLGAVPLTALRRLQLGLAGLWLFDGVLQLQPFMFTKQFAGTTLAPTVTGNPGIVADPISWASGLVSGHPAAANTAFALIQLALGGLIAWRATVRLGLAAAVLWSAAVWWLGEGFGGVLTGSADPVSGAPGAVVLYGLLSVLLWPGPARGGERPRPAAFPAAGFVGARWARVLWTLLWGSLAYLSMQPANTGSGGLTGQLTAMAQGQPGWLTALPDHVARLVAGHDLAASAVLATVLALVALVGLLPGSLVRTSRVLLGLGILTAAGIWLIGEAAGALLSGTGTDPNTGPLLVLLALAYWPVRAARPAPVAEGESASATASAPAPFATPAAIATPAAPELVRAPEPATPEPAKGVPV